VAREDLEVLVTMNQHLGERARAARVRLELTQAQVALRIGLATEVYGRIERGHMTPSLPALMRMCRVLELEANDLLGFDLAAPPPWLKPVAERTRVRPAFDSFLQVVERLTRRQVRALADLAQCMLPSVETRPERTPRPVDATEDPPV
jgi:transcriptional regulator with XRE-family HTH domain